MGELNFVLSIFMLLVVLIITLVLLSKSIKSMKLKVNLQEGFEFNCEFFEEPGEDQ